MFQLQELYELPNEIAVSDPEARFIEQVGREVDVRVEYYDYDGERALTIRFTKVKAYCYTADYFSPEWKQDMADKLAIVVDSPWAAEIKRQAEDQTIPITEMNHYLFFLDDDGGYEIIAKSWRILEPGEA